MDSPPPTAQETFVGRERLLERLLSAWREVRGGRAGPRAVVLLAEPGLGKTRLAQELYRRLVALEQDGAGYWPRELGREGDNLKVNPDEGSSDAAGAMSFLWWGIRLSDPGERNQLSTGALPAHVENHLVPHLEPFHREQRRRQRLLQVAKIGGVVAADAVIDLVPFLGLVKKVGEVGLELKGIHDEWRKDSRIQPAAEAATARRTSLVERVIADLERLFSGPAGRQVPAVILFDDAQFSASDPAVTALVAALLPAMSKGRWPLLLVVTHWEREWNTGPGEPGGSPVAALLRDYAMEQLEGVEVLGLEPLADLAPLLRAWLPGLPPEQVGALVGRAGGNPRFMEEIVQFASSTRGRALFVGRDPTAAMTPHGLESLLAKSVELRELVAERIGGAPDEVQRVIAIAGLQGEEFGDGVVAATAARLDGSDSSLSELEESSRIIDLAATPYAVVSRLEPGRAAFNQRLYREVARELLPAWYDEAEAEEALRTVVRDVMLGDVEPLGAADPGVLKLAVELFEDAPDAGDLRIAVHALHLLLETARQAGDLHGARTLASKQAELLGRLPDERLDGDLAWLRAANDALATVGEADAQRPLLTRLIDLTGAAFEDDVNPWSVAMYVEALLDVAEFHEARGDRESQARALWQGVTVLSSEGLEGRTDVPLLRASLRLHRLHSRSAAARGELEESRELQRHAALVATRLLAIDDNRGARFDVASGHAGLGRAALAAGDLQEASSELEQAQAGLRSLLADGPDPGIEIALAATLDHLAEARAVAGDVTGAAGPQRESVALMRRHLAAAPEAAQARSNLADSLERLAELEDRGGELDRAWQLLTEALELRKRVAATVGGASYSEHGIAMARAVRLAHARGDDESANELASAALVIARRTAGDAADVAAQWRLLYVLDAALPVVAARQGLSAGRALLEEVDTAFAKIPATARPAVARLMASLESHRAALADRIGLGSN